MRGHRTEEGDFIHHLSQGGGMGMCVISVLDCECSSARRRVIDKERPRADRVMVSHKWKAFPFDLVSCNHTKLAWVVEDVEVGMAISSRPTS